MQFAYSLALQLGEWDVIGLLSQMSNRQFVGWLSYYQLNPWGDDRADLRSAIVASTVANTARKRGARPFKPKDFMAIRKRQTPDQQWNMLTAFFEMQKSSANGNKRQSK